MKKYKPSNGTEGLLFFEQWCAKCSKEAAMNGTKQYDECDSSETCKIIADTFFYRVDEDEYPSEWIVKDGCPMCTAFMAIEK